MNALAVCKNTRYEMSLLQFTKKIIVTKMILFD